LFLRSLQPCWTDTDHSASRPISASGLSMDLHLLRAVALHHLLDGRGLVRWAGDPDADAVLLEARVVGRRGLDLGQARQRQHAEQVRQPGDQDHARVAEHRERRHAVELLAADHQRPGVDRVPAQREAAGGAEEPAHGRDPAYDRWPLPERYLDLVVRHRREHAYVLVPGLAQGGHGLGRVVDEVPDAHHAVELARRREQQLRDRADHRWPPFPRRGAGSVSLISAIENAGSTRTNTRKNMKNHANEPTMSAISVMLMR